MRPNSPFNVLITRLSLSSSKRLLLLVAFVALLSGCMSPNQFRASPTGLLIGALANVTGVDTMLQPPDPRSFVVTLNSDERTCTVGSSVRPEDGERLCSEAKQRRTEEIAAEQARQDEINKAAKAAEEEKARVEKIAADHQKEIEGKGYKPLTIEDFQLDAESMPIGKQIYLTGWYEIAGNFQSLKKYPSIAMQEGYKIQLLTSDSPRETRKKLIKYQICSYQTPCELTFIGRVNRCGITYFGQQVREVPCVSVDDVVARWGEDRT